MRVKCALLPVNSVLLRWLARACLARQASTAPPPFTSHAALEPRVIVNAQLADATCVELLGLCLVARAGAATCGARGWDRMHLAHLRVCCAFCAMLHRTSRLLFSSRVFFIYCCRYAPWLRPGGIHHLLQDALFGYTRVPRGY